MKSHPITDSNSQFSIIIPTLDGSSQLRELLASFSIQTKKPLEVLVIDSTSSDTTVRVAESYGAEVITISRDTFDHGGTRTMGAKRAKGSFLVFLTQDALPTNRSMLERLVQPLADDSSIAASYGRQLPCFDATDVARHLRLFNYPAQSQIKGYKDRKELGLATVFISNSCAAYNKKLLSEVGFFRDDLIFGEDTCALGRLLHGGYRVAYVSEAVVYHSHNYRWGEEFKRYFDIGVLHRTEKWLLETYGDAEKRGGKYVRSGLSYLLARRKYSLIFDFMVRVMLKYAGYTMGKNYVWIPDNVVPALSLHRKWWHKP